MWKKQLKENTFFILIVLLKEFFWSIIASIGLFMNTLFGRKPRMLQENRFLDAMNFFLHIGPKSFWKAPSWIKIGRSISTFLHYVFKKEQVFSEKKK